jgi:hypothetical protein
MGAQMNLQVFDHQSRLELLQSRYRCYKQAQFMQDLKDWRAAISNELEPPNWYHSVYVTREQTVTEEVI